MAFQQKELSGSLFKNDRKEKDTDPSMTGSCLIDGVEYWIKAWTKEGQKGRWQSLSFQRKNMAGQSQPSRPNVKNSEDTGADIPF